jgi:hypothetical protein
MGQLTVSIAHELIYRDGRQRPGSAALARPRSAGSEEVPQTLASIVTNAVQASDVVDRIRDLVKKASPRRDCLVINDAIPDVSELTCGEATKNGVAPVAHPSDRLPSVEGDRAFCCNRQCAGGCVPSL